MANQAPIPGAIARMRCRSRNASVGLAKPAIAAGFVVAIVCQKFILIHNQFT